MASYGGESEVIAVYDMAFLSKTYLLHHNLMHMAIFVLINILQPTFTTKQTSSDTVHALNEPISVAATSGF